MLGTNMRAGNTHPKYIVEEQSSEKNTSGDDIIKVE